MNESTKDVTLYSGFIFDLLVNYESSRTTFSAALFEMAEGLDPAHPTTKVPIALYNTMCSWIEENFGASNLRLAGSEIGRRVYDMIQSDPSMETEPDPLGMMNQLVSVASEVIQDPEKRGWEILESNAGQIVMRRTQTFNCVLQEGLLQSLVQHCRVKLVAVRHLRCRREGADFCDYAISWHSRSS